MDKRDLALDLYNSFKGNKRTIFHNTVKENTEVRSNADEPKPIGDLIKDLVSQRQWQSGLAEGEVLIKWAEIVGDEIASKSEPIEIKDQKLFVKCESTAWATQLNLIKHELLLSIQKVAPAILELEIVGPNAPSWRKGLRTIQGSKGPRDTYG